MKNGHWPRLETRGESDGLPGVVHAAENPIRGRSQKTEFLCVQGWSALQQAPVSTTSITTTLEPDSSEITNQQFKKIKAAVLKFESQYKTVIAADLTGTSSELDIINIATGLYNNHYTLRDAYKNIRGDGEI